MMKPVAFNLVPSKTRLPLKKRRVPDEFLDNTARGSVAEMDETAIVPLSSNIYAPPEKRVKTWHVTDDCPQELPPCPLEKTNVAIDRKNASPTEIATRIAETLRVMSVDATFDGKNATALVSTEADAQMHIALFKNQENKGTIVEVQRLQGCGISFHRHARLILNAAQGLTTSALPLKENSKFKIPSSILAKKPVFEPQEEQDGDEKSTLMALQLISSLFDGDQFDTKRLGLESLCKLTHPGQVSTTTALLAAQAVLCGNFVVHPWPEPAYKQAYHDEENCMGASIRDAVLGLVCNNNNTQNTSIHGDNIYHRTAETKALRRLALLALSNALHVVLKKQRGQEILTRTLQQNVCTPELGSAFVELLKDAHASACDAHLAAKCLGSLLVASRNDEAVPCLLEIEDVLPVVKMALEVGRERHHKLQQEAEQLLRLLE